MRESRNEAMNTESRNRAKNFPLKLGFPVKVLGQPELKSNDARRWQNNPHLKVSLEYLDGIFDYLAKHELSMYRMSSEIAPYATHPEMPQFHGMVRESKKELAALGVKARALGIRLSFHPSQYIILNSPDAELVRRSVRDVQLQAEILDLMGMGPEAVVVIHVGGAYGDRPGSNLRWVKTWKKLPEPARRRLVLEHDDLRFSAADVLWIHEQTGVRLIFDYQHFWCFNPERLEMRKTVEKILATWRDGTRPKLHFSSPRTEMRNLERRNPQTGKKETCPLPPLWTGHADFANPFEFCRFMRDMRGLEFDVMLESKSKDLAVIRLRPDMIRYAPDVARRFGLKEAKLPSLADEENQVMPAEGGQSRRLSSDAVARNRSAADL